MLLRLTDLYVASKKGWRFRHIFASFSDVLWYDILGRYFGMTKSFKTFFRKMYQLEYYNTHWALHVLLDQSKNYLMLCWPYAQQYNRHYWSPCLLFSENQNTPNSQELKSCVVHILHQTGLRSPFSEDVTVFFFKRAFALWLMPRDTEHHYRN